MSAFLSSIASQWKKHRVLLAECTFGAKRTLVAIVTVALETLIEIDLLRYVFLQSIVDPLPCEMETEQSSKELAGGVDPDGHPTESREVQQTRPVLVRRAPTAR